MKHIRRNRKRQNLLAGSMAAILTACLLLSPVSAMADQEDADTADIAVAAAIETARNEFDTAVQSAEADVTQAQAALEAAQSTKESAESNVSAAEVGLEQARQEKRAADDALAQFLEENGAVTEDELLAADSHKDAAARERDDAWAAYNAALTAQEEADSAAQEAQSRVDEANAALADAQEKADAVESAANAEEARISSLEADLDTAVQELADDSDYQQAVQDQLQAEEDIEAAKAGKADSDNAVRDAEALLETEQAEQTALEDEFARKKAAAQKAQAELDAANAAKAAAEEAVREAEAAVAESDAAYQTARANTEQKAAEQEDASQAVEAAKAALTEAENEVTRAEAALTEAQQALEDIQDVYDQGSLGFINWMLAKEDLTDEQRADLELAKQVLEKAMEEDFTYWMGGDETGLPAERNGKVVAAGDEKDAISLSNTEKIFDVMRRINELRAADENFSGDLQRNDALTNFYFMAVAQSGADRGAGLMRHSRLQVSSENLAFGYTSDPTLGWYDKEKISFDAIRDELGLSAGSLTKEDIGAIEEEAGRRGVTVGHYTNLFWSRDQLMGVGFTPYGKTLRNTFCYNASAASNFEGRYAMYTVDDFKTLFEEYCDSLNVTVLQQAITDAESIINNANTTREEKLAALQSARDAAERVGQELEEARSAETSAQEKVSVLQAAVQEKESRVAEAQAVVDTMLNVLEEAEAEVTAAENGVLEAKVNTEAAQTALDDAKTAQREAGQKVAEAETIAAEKKSIAEHFNDVIAQISQTLDEAREHAAALWDRLTGKKAEIAAAEVEKAAAAEAIVRANANAAETREEASAAKDAYTTAQTAAENAENRSDALHQKYNDMTAAADRIDEAKKAVTDAEAALAAANTALDEACRKASDTEAAKAAAQDKLERARTLSYDEALTTPITDEDFSYLNEYIQAVLDAQAEAEAAQKALEEAQRENADPAADVYRMLEGGGSHWTLGGDGVLTFRADGDYAKFLSVSVDGVALSPEDYTSAEGSTIVNLSASCLNKLSAGEHTIRVEFTDGEASAAFTVDDDTDSAAENPAAAKDNAAKFGPERNGRYGAPKTGDETPLSLYIVLGVASLLGLILLIRFRKARDM